MSVFDAGHVWKQSVQYNAAANCTTTRPSGKTLLFDATPQHNTTQQHNNTSQPNTTSSIYISSNSYSYISPTDPFKLLS